MQLALDSIVCQLAAVGSLLGRENMRCREELGRPAGLPNFLRGSRRPAERLLKAPGLVRSS